MSNAHLDFIADELLKELDHEEGYPTHFFVSTFSSKYSESDIESALQVLYLNGISTYSQTGDHILTQSGLRFRERGGFEGVFKRRKQKAIRAKKATDFANKATQSAIDTNTFIRRSGRWQVGTSIASALVAIVALYVAFKAGNDFQMQKLIEQQNQKFDSMVKVQHQIEQHLSRITKDPLYLPIQLPGSSVDKNLRKTSR